MGFSDIGLKGKALFIRIIIPGKVELGIMKDIVYLFKRVSVNLAIFSCVVRVCPANKVSSRLLLPKSLNPACHFPSTMKSRTDKKSW